MGEPTVELIFRKNDLEDDIRRYYEKQMKKLFISRKEKQRLEAFLKSAKAELNYTNLHYFEIRLRKIRLEDDIRRYEKQMKKLFISREEKQRLEAKLERAKDDLNFTNTVLNVYYEGTLEKPEKNPEPVKIWNTGSSAAADKAENTGSSEVIDKAGDDNTSRNKNPSTNSHTEHPINPPAASLINPPATASEKRPGRMKCLRCGAEIDSTVCHCGFNLTVDTFFALGIKPYSNSSEKRMQNFFVLSRSGRS